MPTDEDKEPEVTEPKGDRPQWVDEILEALKPKDMTTDKTVEVPLPPEPDDDLEDDDLEEPEDEPKPKASFWSKIW